MSIDEGIRLAFALWSIMTFIGTWYACSQIIQSDLEDTKKWFIAYILGIMWPISGPILIIRRMIKDRKLKRQTV